MSTANPLEQLRRRMQSHATPAAFAALAEEHRRAGRLVEAIAVCRDGLERYPAYVSARVTLGRALLDSGDVASAVAELEQAAAQAPDNLAAARALALAHDSAGAAPPPPPLPAPAAVSLHAAEDEDTASIPPAVIAQALTAGPDRPQEFGLDADWSIPDSPWTIPDAPEPAPGVEQASPLAATPAWTDDEGAATEALFPHAEAPTMFLAPQHLQGEEPAGIWPVPAMPAIAEPLGVWDALTIEAAVADLAPSSVAPESEPPASDPAAADVELAPAAESAGPADATDDRPCFWTGVFGGEPDMELPPPFSGWGDELAPPSPGVGLSPWTEGDFGDQTGPCVVPDGPSAAWALGELHQATGAAPEPVQAAPDEVGEAPSAPVLPPVLAAEAFDVLPADVAWVGSVRSALGEVYAQAGHGQSLEPPCHPSPAVRGAMADAAVEAALEDAVLRDDAATPALVSLQQMLESVRARRAALFHDIRS